MKFKVDKGPHIKSSDNTSKIMKRLLIALTPIIIFSLYKNISLLNKSGVSLINSFYPLYILLLAVISSITTELLYNLLILKTPISKIKEALKESYWIFPGLFLSLIIPINTPLLIVMVGAITATLIGKLLFGGFGYNIFNPALIGGLIIGTAYSSTTNLFNLSNIDVIGGVTPLSNLSNFNYIGTYEQLVGSFGTLKNFLFGYIPGTLGETSKILILLAFIYLALTKVIKTRIPILYILTVFIMTSVIGFTNNLGIWYPLFHILSGGLLFGAVFMATDPITSPITKKGQILYGISLGILTVVLRFTTSFPEGVLTSILFMNMLVPLFDKVGLNIKNNNKKSLIAFLIILILGITTTYLINNDINKEKDSNVKIINIDKKDNITIYTLSSKGWGVMIGELTVKDNILIDINILNKEVETRWASLEKVDYIKQILDNQNDLDKVDTISSVTKTCDGIKEMVRYVQNKYGVEYEN